MSRICEGCGKEIEEDSLFCKYCGTRQTFKVHDTQDIDLKTLFLKVRETLIKTSTLTEEEFERTFDRYKHYEKRVLTDDEYYRAMVDIIFYSGFRASTVDKYLAQIHYHFPSIETVVHYSNERIDEIKNDPKMLKNKAKIDACFQNAKQFSLIVKKSGSFKAFVDSYHPDQDDESLLSFKRAIDKNFAFLGGITAYHFLMDIGLNVLKPDRVLLRVLSRLNLIQPDDNFGAIKIGRAISAATGYPIRYVDIVFVLYGQMNQPLFATVCSEENPKCLRCGVSSYCSYFKSLKNSSL